MNKLFIWLRKIAVPLLLVIGIIMLIVVVPIYRPIFFNNIYISVLFKWLLLLMISYVGFL